MAQEKTIYDLELHEVLNFNNGIIDNVTRVPGGWIYNFYPNNQDSCQTFVPFDNEFRVSEYLQDKRGI